MSAGTKAAILLVLLVFAISAIVWPLAMGIYLEQQAQKKERNGLPRFDERQKLARLRASAHALYALLGLLAVWTVLDMTGLAAWTDSVIDLFLCALALFHGVWTLDCLLHDAYIGWRAKPHANGFASLIAMYLFFLTNTFRAGAVTATWLPLLFAGGGFGAVLGGVLWQQRREKGQTEDAAL